MISIPLKIFMPLDAKQSQFDIPDLESGIYMVRLFGVPKKLWGINGLQDQELNLMPGETKQVNFNWAEEPLTCIGIAEFLSCHSSISWLNHFRHCCFQ